MINVQLTHDEKEFIENALLNLSILIKNHGDRDIKIFVEDYTPESYLKRLEEVRDLVKLS